MTVRIVPAMPPDAEALVAVQHAAFASQAELYGAPDIPPMRETADDIRRAMRHSLVLKAVTEDGSAVGSVRGTLRDGVVEVGRLAVHPDAQGAGTGRRLLEALEEAFPTVTAFALFTGHLSEKQLDLYRSLGYVEVRREPVEGGRVELVHMRKERGE